MKIQTMGYHDARYGVNPTTNCFPSGPPITLTIVSGAIHLQDYLTPDEADQLADALHAEAVKAREAEKVAA